MKRYVRCITLFILTVSTLISCAHVQKNDVVFQSSTINALLKGIYDGDVTFGELKRNGDFGLGTFNGLDGEMIGLAGTFYQIKADGVAYPVEDSVKTPFSVVSFFAPDDTLELDTADSYTQLKRHIDGLLPSQNIFYAIRIDGNFKYIKTRSVPGQQKPYPPLVEVVKEQSVFEFQNSLEVVPVQVLRSRDNHIPDSGASQVLFHEHVGLHNRAVAAEVAREIAFDL